MITVLKADVQILLRMLRGRSQQGSHQQQLEDFYASQAENYDQFRKKLLHGRRELLEAMEITREHTIVELGAGTGHNLSYLEHPLQSYLRIEIVDLCPSLLSIAKRRYGHLPNLNIIEADATIYKPDILVDRVYLSYALTMVPDWKNAIDNALRMLKPGGLIGVVDFYVSDVSRPWYARLLDKFWQRWFAHDGVHLTADHLQYLRSVTETISLQESRANLPYLPLLKAPYYIYVGQKTVAVPAGICVECLN